MPQIIALWASFWDTSSQNILTSSLCKHCQASGEWVIRRTRIIHCNPNSYKMSLLVSNQEAYKRKHMNDHQKWRVFLALSGFYELLHLPARAILFLQYGFPSLWLSVWTIFLSVWKPHFSLSVWAHVFSAHICMSAFVGGEPREDSPCARHCARCFPYVNSSPPPVGYDC